MFSMVFDKLGHNLDTLDKKMMRKAAKRDAMKRHKTAFLMYALAVGGGLFWGLVGTVF